MDTPARGGTSILARGGTLLGTATAALLLLAAAPSPQDALRQLHDAGPDPTAPVVAASTLAAWGLAAWLTATVLLVLAASLPGLAGTTCAALSRRIAPGAVRRAVEVALGLTVAVGALGTAPASAAPDDRQALGTAPAGAAGVHPAAAVPELDWPVLPAVPTDGPDRRSDPRSTREPVLVQPGDCLWDVASRQLLAAGTPAASNAEIAQAWPRWWTANRHVVGDDPDLLRPGMRLSPPAAG